MTVASKRRQPFLTSQLSALHGISRSRAYSDGPNTPTHNIAILGGGVTGLASAYYLTKELPKAKITIYEASDRIGGWLSSTRVPVKDGTILFEAGPRTLRPVSNGVLAARMVRNSVYSVSKQAQADGYRSKSST